jgi:hypothetical protein
MNKPSLYVLKALRKLYPFKRNTFYKQDDFQKDNTLISKIIADELMANKPTMIARFGSTELLCLSNYYGIHLQKRSFWGYIQGKNFPWWWEPSTLQQMQQWSGFFPPTIDNIEKFCELMLNDIPEVDILGTWLKNEDIFSSELSSAKKVGLLGLDPYWAIDPWTKVLEGKKVLVVHPFADTIAKQYKKRELLFTTKLLPAFDLITIKAVQSLGGVDSGFKNWFEALDFMKEQIKQQDFDICLIGAGAYGFPLAAHVKRLGKKGFHMGGSLQLLFGIRGKRWETGNYKEIFGYHTLINEHWVRPDSNERPVSAEDVEDSCYW